MLTVEEHTFDKITETIYRILKGEKPPLIQISADYPENEIKQLIQYVNQLVSEYNEFSEFMYSIATGELDYKPPKGKMRVVNSFKNLQSNLRHLTWKTQQIAAGDFEQRVDFMGDFSKAFNSMAEQLKNAFEQIKREKERSESLLLNILPAKVVSELKEFGKSEPQTFENVSVLFSDIVGFTNISATVEPAYLISELNDIFTRFDEIMSDHHCERIKTIGDAYLSVCGMPEKENHHAHKMISAGIDMIKYIREYNEKKDSRWKIRIGIHSGKLVGGIVGVKKYIYDIFGDTINTASRMESNSEPMKINISEVTYNIVKDSFKFIEREPLAVKGKGIMKMYFVDA